ncbi:MAG: hypothetical protein Q7T86_16410 [Hyphomicrobiaceae bacterium]|nr:hypothetical protein [Hyphomicrobiaceae bacterium]
MRVASLALLAACGVFNAAVAQCVKDAREAKFGEGNAKLVTFLCKAEGGATPSVRVEFHRLSEAAAAGVVAGKPWPEVSAVIGKARVLDNGVGREALNLYKNYGITEDREDAFHFRAIGGEAEAEPDKVPAGTGRKAITYLTYPDTEGLTGQSMALPDEDKIIRSTQRWPDDLKFYYKGEDCKPGNYSCITLWRYLAADDLGRFEERWQAQQAIMRVENPDFAAAQDTNEEPIPTPGSGPIKLLQYLTKDTWPDDFVVVTGSYNGCGGGYDFSYYPRQMVMDVAVIQNVSSKAITVGDLLGTQVEDTGLRPPAAPMRGVVAAGIVPIPGAVGKLAPNERVLVPLKMTFVAPKGLASNFAGKLADARKIYSAVEKLPPGTVIKEEPPGEQSTLQKTKESFRAPELPKVTPYMWGPEITLKGLNADGKRIILEETSANFLELTAGEGYGSCPFLYSYDDAAKTWVSHGKVIDNADDPAKEMTQDIAITAFATRFRLAEEELEMSEINRVVLNVTRKDGEALQLIPDDIRLKDKDDRYVRILAGRAINIAFSLPAGVAPADIATSKLSVTGYYRRYSSLNVVDLRKPDPAPKP